MTPAEIVNFARKQTGTPTNEINDNDMYEYLNFVYKDLWYKIVDIDKNYAMNTWTNNLVNTSNEYPLLSVVQSPATFWQFKIESVEVKYSNTQQNYTKATEIDWDYFKAGADWYADNQPTENPLYIISNDSIFLFPQPKVNVGNWLKLRATLKPYNLTPVMNESDILIKPEFHSVLMRWMKVYIAEARQQVDLYNQYLVAFEKDVKTMLDNLTIVVTEKVQGFSNNFYWY